MGPADDTALAGLRRVGGRPSLSTYLAEVWRRRAFITSLARFRVEAETGRNRLGTGWLVLRPLLNAGVYGLVFGFVLQTSRDVDDFIAFLVVGVFMFEFFSTCLTTGAKSITGNAALVQSLSFPRMALPLALVAQRFLQFLPMLAMMLAAAVLFGHWPRPQWLLLVPLVVLFTLFNTGLTLITARLTVHLRDLTHLLPFISRLFFYTSGVFYSIEERLGARGWISTVADLQPVHEFLSLARGILLQGPDHMSRPEYWAYATLWSLGSLVVGVVFFWIAEERYGRTD
ncbi:ABC transporter permease [Aeromicrobium sp. CTD01-1L150]|uniref:ABC transporter permease n=1 Tax=Aeromicrobium sp. CTD01-1L150 TaxID=3341830 RepID=UPI0035BF046C